MARTDHAKPAEAAGHTSENAEQVAAPFVDPRQQIDVACRNLGGAFYLPFNRAIEAAYRAQNGRIPGSNRTSRLRKKRRDAVDRWSTRRLGS